MAEHANVDRVRRGYAAFDAGDLDTLRDLFADDIVWHISGSSPLTGDYKGHDEVFGMFGRFFELTGGTAVLDVHDVLANDAHAVALVHVTATRDDRRLEQEEVHVFHVSDGKVTEFWEFLSDQAASDAFFA